MAVSKMMGNQIMQEFEKKKIKVILLGAPMEVRGILFTAQDDYLQVDDQDRNARVTIPTSAIALVVPI